MIRPFKVIKKKSILPELKFSQAMKIHNVFHSNLFQKALINLLADQINELTPPVIVNKEEKWKFEDILDLRSF